jgi:hypothetical protein
VSGKDVAALIDARQFKAALPLCERQLEADPSDISALINKGSAQLGIGDPTQARRSFNRAINEDPTIASAWDGLGKAQYELGDPIAAAKAFRTAANLSEDPALSRYHRSLALLLAGRFEEGWTEYEERINVPALGHRRYDKPRWTGEPLNGKRLLVVAEQGYGDMIQFARYLPWLTQFGGPLTLEAPATLLPLFQPLANDIALVASDDGPRPETDFDCHVYLMSLGHIHGTSEISMPSEMPYIAAPTDRIGAWRSELDVPGFKIGIAWAGRPSHPQDAQRSMDSALLEPLTEIENIRLFSLQKDKTTRPLTRHLEDRLAGDFGGRLTSFAETAAIITHLDLIITVDTSLAHLAGALGKSVWTLLPYAPDWRWMMTGEDTLWYPTMRLFRQTAEKDWSSAMKQLLESLNKVII